MLKYFIMQIKGDTKMSEVKMFKIEEKFSSTGNLYRYLIKNVDFIGKSIGVQIQKPIKAKPFCVVGKEKITERNILFFASKSEYPESLGELIILAGAFDADIIVFFLPKINNAHSESLSWLQKICNDDTQFIVSEVDF
jgi:hypothetical protein